MKKMLLVDGNSMLFRAFYATFMRPMSTSTGIPTNAIYGFAMMINKAVQIIQPDAMLVAFDKGKHTFRPVSYTHLDVYKRQAGYRGPAGQRPRDRDLVKGRQDDDPAGDEPRQSPLH